MEAEEKNSRLGSLLVRRPNEDILTTSESRGLYRWKPHRNRSTGHQTVNGEGRCKREERGTIPGTLPKALLRSKREVGFFVPEKVGPLTFLEDTQQHSKVIEGMDSTSLMYDIHTFSFSTFWKKLDQLHHKELLTKNRLAATENGIHTTGEVKAQRGHPLDRQQTKSQRRG